MNLASKNATIVLVHRPWADGSSWREVISLLQRQGIHLISAPIPFTSLGDDVAALCRALERTDGPVVLTAADQIALAKAVQWPSPTNASRRQRPSLPGTANLPGF
jgi:hypothetical protein